MSVFPKCSMSSYVYFPNLLLTLTAHLGGAAHSSTCRLLHLLSTATSIGIKVLWVVAYLLYRPGTQKDVQAVRIYGISVMGKHLSLMFPSPHVVIVAALGAIITVYGKA